MKQDQSGILASRCDLVWISVNLNDIVEAFPNLACNFFHCTVKNNEIFAFSRLLSCYFNVAINYLVGMWRLCASGHRGASNIGSQLPLCKETAHRAGKSWQSYHKPQIIWQKRESCTHHTKFKISRKRGGTITNRLKHKNVDDLNQ